MTMPDDPTQPLCKLFPVWEKLSTTARSSAKPIYLVGGALRDLLRSKSLNDLDFACPAADMPFWEDFLSQEMKGHFITMGAEKFLTRRLVGSQMTIDLAALADSDLNRDLKRRDFTINAMAWGLHEQLLHDPCGGRKDLDAGIIDCVTPENILADPLRIIRAARFMLALDGTLTPACKEALRAGVSHLDQIAKERIAIELNHILAHPQAARGLEELAQIGALQKILPILAPLEGLEQNNFHHLDAFSHTLATVAALDHLCLNNAFALTPPSAADRVLVKWAALLHDTGKALTRTVDPDTGTIHFYGHERFSAHLARESLSGYGLGNKFLQRLSRLIENHLRPLLLDPDHAKEKSLRRLVFDLEDDLELLLLHALADLEATRGRDPGPRRENLRRLCRRLKEIYHLERAGFIKPLLSGKDLLALGLEPGPAVGIMIKLIHKKQLAGTINSREQALAEARNLIAG
ncbi:MAG: HD domain-containing protein [Deltaproteobacteria bacterium]|nr:HD domain-containing protein [Deltaproteobacteria bacterium]